MATPTRTYLTGLSMGGYGSWELAKAYPHRWAAIAIAAGGIFWSYEPERWQAGFHSARRIRARRGPHAALALPRQPAIPSSRRARAS